MDKKTVMAIVLCVVVWIIWSTLFMETPGPPRGVDGGIADGGVAFDAERGPKDRAEDSRVAGKPEESPPAERPDEGTATIANELLKATFTSRGASLKSLKLARFKERDETKSEDQLGQEDLISTEDESILPLGIRFRKENTSFELGSYTDWQIVRKKSEEVVFRYVNPKDSQVPVITKTFTVKPDSYLIELAVELENRSESSVKEQIILDMFAEYSPPVQTGCFGVPAAPRTPMCMKGEEVFPSASGCESGAKMNPGEVRSEEPDISWTGISEQYFLMAAIPLGVEQSVCRLEARHDNTMVASLMYPEKDIPPGDTARHLFRFFLGPKQMDLLKQVKGGTVISGAGQDDRSARLDSSIDYGWFSFLCHPMLWLLKNFYSFLGNYGLAIILLTIVIKIVLLPLTNKSMKSMAEMAKLKPLMEELKKKYGDDKQRLNQEMMNLYKTHKINPAGGCFPMLLQMPIWIALYRMLYSSVELYQAPFIKGWLSDLSFRDPYFIMPIVLGATMFLQQKLSPTAADTQQAKMMLYMMPAFFTFIMLYLPSGLVLYIFVNSVLSIAHQWTYNRMKNKPVVVK